MTVAMVNTERNRAAAVRPTVSMRVGDMCMVWVIFEVTIKWFSDNNSVGSGCCK